MASTSQEKGRDLEGAKKAFETTISHDDTLNTVISVRRRLRAKTFECEDLLFVVEFKQSTQGGSLPLMDCLVAVYRSVLDQVNKTKGTLVHERGYRLLDGVEVIT